MLGILAMVVLIFAVVHIAISAFWGESITIVMLGLIIGAVSLLISTFFIYGFGQLIEDTSAIRTFLKEKNK